MLEFVAAREVPQRQAELFLFDLQFDGADGAAVTWGDEIDEATKADSPVVVIGAGMAGINAGIRLQQAGLPFTILEKNAASEPTSLFSSRARRALLIVDSILPRWRTMPASFNRRRTSRARNPATE